MITTVLLMLLVAIVAWFIPTPHHIRRISELESEAEGASRLKDSHYRDAEHWKRAARMQRRSADDYFHKLKLSRLEVTRVTGQCEELKSTAGILSDAVLTGVLREFELQAQLAEAKTILQVWQTIGLEFKSLLRP